MFPASRSFRLTPFICILIGFACPGTATRLAAQGHGVSPAMSHSIQVPAQRRMRPAGLPDTVRALAVRVEFQTDDNAATSGTGKFGTIYSYDYGQEVIDPYPHDRSHFVNHLHFLENYVSKVSGGRTTLVGTVLDSIVTVSKQIKDYSSKKGGSDKPVADLALEAWTIVDARFPNVDLAAYDMFIVFHASKGRDVDLTAIQGYDPTPLDIPSLSFTLDAFKRFYGQDYQGIPVRGGAFHITNSSIIPTTDNREITQIDGSKTLLELTINGLLAASFGTYAGLPDLFDTKTGRTGIGRFGLMDGESIFAYGGIAPPAPSAWEKQMLNWAQAKDATPGKSEYLLIAGRTDQSLTSGVLRVPITGREYWLVENRHRDPAGNGQRVTMISGGREITMRFPKDTLGFENGGIAALKGVVTDVEDLDWALPGGLVVGDNNAQVQVSGGILIWHIDEAVIEAGLADNTVNADPAHRGVDLEQAGGPQDIGKSITSVFGTTIGAGSPLDFWFSGNISPVYTNSFGPYTQPSSATNSGAFSHVVMDHFSPAGPVMSLDVSLGDQVVAPAPGFPVDLRPFIHGTKCAALAQATDFDVTGTQDILVAATTAGADTGYVFGLRQDGSNLRTVNGTPLIAKAPGVEEWLAPPVRGDFDADGVVEVALTARRADGAALIIFKDRDTDGDGLFDVRQTVAGLASPVAAFDGAALYYAVTTPAGNALTRLGATTTYAIPGAATDPVHLALAGSGRVFVATPAYQGFFTASTGAFSDGVSWYAPVTRPGFSSAARNCVCADFDGDGIIDGAALEGDRLVFVLSSGHGTIAGQKIASALVLKSSHQTLSSCDVDGDGRDDLVIADSSALHVLNLAAASLDEYPLTTDARHALAARFAGHAPDAVLIAGSGGLQQLGTRARQAEGFPIAIAEASSVALIAHPVDQKKVAGIVAAGSDGRVYLYETPHTMDATAFPWAGVFGNDGNADRVMVAPAGATTGEYFPMARCYCWPNPVYEGLTKIRFFVGESSDVSVKIYDIAGEKVTELSARAIGGVDNEIDWPVSSIQNGVYLAHVRATGNGRTAEKIIKIAVVK